MHLLSAASLAALLPHISVLAVIAAAKLGVIMPLIVAALAQPRFSARSRTALSIVSCLVASAAVCLAGGVFSGLNWAASTVILLATTWSLYEHFYKPTGIAPWFEQITSVVPYLIGLMGGKAVAAMQTASSAANAAIAQSQAPLALPAPTVSTGDGGDTLLAAASRAAAQAEEAGDKASQVARIAENVAAQIGTIGSVGQ